MHGSLRVKEEKERSRELLKTFLFGLQFLSQYSFQKGTGL